MVTLHETRDRIGTRVPAVALQQAGTMVPASGPKSLDRTRETLCSRRYSRRTEQTYRHWVKRFICFHSVRHPAERAEPESNAFLTHPGAKEKVSALHAEPDLSRSQRRQDDDLRSRAQPQSAGCPPPGGRALRRRFLC
jgi:hypothetical protein